MTVLRMETAPSHTPIPYSERRAVLFKEIEWLRGEETLDEEDLRLLQQLQDELSDRD